MYFSNNSSDSKCHNFYKLFESYCLNHQIILLGDLVRYNLLPFFSLPTKVKTAKHKIFAIY